MSAQPSAAEAERALLGCILNGADVDEVADEVTGADFYQPRHEAIWDAAVAVHRRGSRPDVALVEAQLGAELAKIGGVTYLFEIASVEVAPTPVQAPHYARMVAGAALRRRLIDASTTIGQIARQAEDPNDAANEAQKIIEAVTAEGINDEAGVGAADLVREMIDSLESEVDTGISTGWADLDQPVNGLRPGQLVIVGARPSIGKSVVGANLAAAACLNGVPVHFASLEMTRDEVIKRMTAAHATVYLHRLINHDLQDADWDRIARKGSKVGDWPLRVDDTAGQSLAQLRARARSTKRRMGLGLLVVDYLQLMAARDRRVPREQQVGELSEGLKNLAKELRIPVVALAQLNRGSADRQDKRPVISDLRESGRIEQDADHVWLLHRQDMVDPNSTTGELEVYVAKNRNGVQGETIRLQFQGQYARAVQRVWSPTQGVA